MGVAPGAHGSQVFRQAEQVRHDEGAGGGCTWGVQPIELRQAVFTDGVVARRQAGMHDRRHHRRAVVARHQHGAAGHQLQLLQGSVQGGTPAGDELSVGKVADAGQAGVARAREAGPTQHWVARKRWADWVRRRGGWHGKHPHHRAVASHAAVTASSAVRCAPSENVWSACAMSCRCTFGLDSAPRQAALAPTNSANSRAV